MLLNRVFDSLKARLLASVLLLTVVLLPVLGIFLSQAFEEHIKAAIKNELTAYSYSILAVAESIDDELYLPEQLLENQFNVIDSGLYAVIYPYALPMIEEENTINKPLWQSASALSLNYVPIRHKEAMGVVEYNEQHIDGELHLVFSYAVSFAEYDKELPVVLYIIKNKAEFNQTVSQFNEQIVVWLLVIFVLLLSVQLVWLFWTLKPLAKFRSELTSIKQGHSAAIKGQYPLELRQVTEQLNLLLQTEQNQRVRYRNALSDLAHSLKTPLAVMQAKSGHSDDHSAEINKINQTIEHQLKRAQSAGESSWRLGCDMNEVADELLQALSKIYRDKSLTFTRHIPEKTVFKGDKADLTELLGNLLDNASKAATSKVSIEALVVNRELIINISDDGQGMTPEQASQVLERGTRVDTYEQGHGIGLAIVKDLVQSYHGKLNISRSEQYRGAQFTLTFPLS